MRIILPEDYRHNPSFGSIILEDLYTSSGRIIILPIGRYLHVLTFLSGAMHQSTWRSFGDASEKHGVQYAGPYSDTYVQPTYIDWLWPSECIRFITSQGCFFVWIYRNPFPHAHQILVQSHHKIELICTITMVLFLSSYLLWTVRNRTCWVFVYLFYLGSA